MIEAAPAGANRAAELRAAFDSAFAAPPAAVADPGDRFLLIGVAGDAFLLRLREVGGLVALRRIVPVPSDDPALLGITALRRAILPVYRLGAVLGLAPAAVVPRWLAIAAAAPVAFAFDRLDRQLALVPDRIVARDAPVARGHVCESGRIAPHTHGIVSLPSVLAAVGRPPP